MSEPEACIYRTMRGTCCNQSKKIHLGSNTNEMRLRRKRFLENSPFDTMRESVKTRSFWHWCECVALGGIYCGGFEIDPFYCNCKMPERDLYD
jgi:hypothetical protein